jgi:hypothetical protein
VETETYRATIDGAVLDNNVSKALFAASAPEKTVGEQASKEETKHIQQGETRKKKRKAPAPPTIILRKSNSDNSQVNSKDANVSRTSSVELGVDTKTYRAKIHKAVLDNNVSRGLFAASAPEKTVGEQASKYETKHIQQGKTRKKKRKAIRPYSLHNLQIFFPGLFMRAVFYISQVQIRICLGSLEFYHNH